jgi:hypothetical protein
MHRFTRTGWILVAALYAAACSSGDSATGATAAPVTTPAHVSTSPPTPGTCTTLSALTALVNTVFGAGSPDANSALGKLNNVKHQIDIGDFAAAQGQAFNLVTFILAKYKQGGLPGSSADVVSLVNGIFCYAGLAISITDPANSWLVYPTDAAQTLVTGNGLAGTLLPGHVVTEPTLVTITQLTDPGFPGAGPLNTKLDQYPYFFEFAKSSATDAPLTQPVVVGVCPAPGIPSDVLARLRLGHDASLGFEITPPADASFLSCPTSTASNRAPAWLRTLASLVLPTPLFARARSGVVKGGVGGTAGTFSPFTPVDTKVSLSGGVGGTAGSFLLGSLLQTVTCSPTEAPIGTPVDPTCRPGVKLQTNLGTLLQNVPVTFDVVLGGGAVAPEQAGSCGGFASSISTATGVNGKAGACWTLGLTVGANTVVASPGVGGDVPPGVTFSPATVTFNATANPPTGLVFTQQPAAGSNVVAGTNIPVTANVVDHNGVTVQAYSGNVTLTLNQNTFSTNASTANAAAAQGVATFSGLAITKAAAGYQMTASATLAGVATSTAGNLFNVVGGPGFGLTIVQGNNQTAPTGTVVPIAPTVQVTDVYANPVNLATILWAAGGASNGSVNPAQTLTGSDGKAATAWTLGDGANELTATLSRPGLGDIAVLFQATGTTTLGVLNSCALGGSGDPINAAGKTYAFWIPNPGPNKVIKEIQLYFSSAGKANTPTPYQVQLTTQLGSFDPAIAPVTATTATVFLRGSNSESKATTFMLSTPVVGSTAKPPVMIQLHVLTNPDGSTINFNTGPCSPGTNCNPPKGCSVTEVNSLMPYPSGTAYRKSVGIVVKGN